MQDFLVTLLSCASFIAIVLLTRFFFGTKER